ncbi:unnamed protein product [Cuscuta epithymum]|uniref:Uncharacterized protein n=1 Tax=Cuscuta epithymum TaxID=186058 RepID=A0AAV0D3L7_9ASTE|nr:unnamed protein product [Cuscuta epithymum]
MLAEAQDTLRLEREDVAKKVEDAKSEARAKGKSDAEKDAAEAAKKAAEDAESSKQEAVAQAKKDVVDDFIAEGWKAEAHNDWVASVVEHLVDAWTARPGAEWLVRKGKDYYDGGEFFTQCLVYRRLARHLNIPIEKFEPASYGLPPRQPDVRIPLPPGEERPDLEDSELMMEAGDDEEEAGEDAASKAAKGDAASNPKEDAQGVDT